jgi:hypothetical protein
MKEDKSPPQYKLVPNNALIGINFDLGNEVNRPRVEKEAQKRKYAEHKKRIENGELSEESIRDIRYSFFNVMVSLFV